MPATASRAAAGALRPAAESRLLWLPVGLLLGVLLYFALPFEPWPWSGAAAALALAGAAVALRRRPLAGLSFAAASTVAFGLAAAQFEAWRVAGPVLADAPRPRFVTGRLVTVEPRVNDVRVVLETRGISGLDAARTPRRVRISIRTRGGIAPVPGAEVQILAILRAPPTPAWPGGFDFARDAWFDGIGAVGFAVGPLKPADGEAVEAGPWSGARAAIEAVRAATTARIRAAVPGETGGVAAALLTGQRGGVPETAMTVIRDAGLAHLLAISGLHLGMVAAFAFFVLRAGLAAVEPVALRYPIKAISAVAALLVAFGYLLISGMTVPTQRAFLMTAVVLLAVTVGRVAISLRLVALAASVILLVAPHEATGASFQLSFAAVLGLVAVWEVLRPHVPDWRAARSWPGRAALYLAGIALTTIIAQAATAPFAIAHFSRFALWGTAANLAAVPVFAMWVMPWGLVALMSLPFGLEAWALQPMSWGIDLILEVARWTAGLPHARLSLPAASPWALAASSAGLLWLCLRRGPWRLAGVGGVAVAALVFAAARPPDILVAGDASLTALRLEPDRLALSTLRRGSFVRESWQRMAGGAATVAWPGSDDDSFGPALRCDSLACIYRPPAAPDRRIAIVRRRGALAEDCGRVDMIVSLVPVEAACPAALGVIDRFDLWRRGTHAITVERDGVRIETVDEARGRRPWNPGRPERGAAQ